jgi:phosphatidylglycerophosphate synthase
VHLVRTRPSDGPPVGPAAPTAFLVGLLTSRSGPVAGLACLVGLAAGLAGLSMTVGLDERGWVVGLVVGLAGSALLTRSMARRAVVVLGPGDRVTAVRAVLVGCVTALSVGNVGGTAPLVTLAAVALVLDAVDGRVARRTSTVSAFGARFDLEVDAFLILVLSVLVAGDLGWTTGGWVLVIGLARYAFVVAGWVLPWLRRTAPPRPWCKVVAAVQGVALTVAAADVLPDRVVLVLLAASLGLLVESFGRETVWLVRHRHDSGALAADNLDGPLVLTGLAVLVVWFALVAPDQVLLLTPGSFVRLPLEAVALVALALVLPPRPRRVVAGLVGVVLGLLTIVKVFDMGFFVVLDRPFDTVIDWRYLGSAIGVVYDSAGLPAAVVAVSAATLLATAVLVLLPLAVVRLSGVVSRHRSVSVQGAVSVSAVWVVVAALGVQASADVPLASTSLSSYAYGQVSRIPSEIADQKAFERAAASDPLRGVPAADQLTGLRGKDVVLAFVESYGRVAVQGSSFSPGVDAVLDSSTAELRAAGFSMRSAFLTSPTFGAVSWLAHSTLQSGLWVDSQQRYDAIVTSRRLTLSDVFRSAGWRTVGDVPANTHDWPQGRFYHYDHVYDSRNVGYRGPRFGYPTMPDQYTLDALQRLELAPTHRRPVLAEVDLLSSHAPWSRTPHLVDQASVGDGSVFDGMPAGLPSEKQVWTSPDRVRAAYGASIQYTLTALVTFLKTYATDNTVLVMLGDHQPATVVSGQDSGHDVPVTIIAKDPAVLQRISSWSWQDGMHPSPAAPVWRMDQFRDRFLSAYGSITR